MLTSLRSTFRLLFVTAFAAMLALPTATMIAPARASASSLAEQLGIPADMIPPDMGQSPLQVFVPDTGHSVRGYMLDYWRANGASTIYGNPISEPYGASNGLYSQAFERGIFQFAPQWMWTDNPAVRLAPIGEQNIRHDRLNTRSDGRRTGAERRTTAWTAGVNNPIRASEVADEGGGFDQTTGFSISGPFAAWYEANEGEFYMGAPLSEPHRERGATVQYFQNGMLMRNDDGAIASAPWPKEHPERYGIDATPIQQGDLPVYSEGLFYSGQNYNPWGVDPTLLTGKKKIVVSIADQYMWAYMGDTVVLESYVSTGIEPNHTETGNFHVRMKYDKQSMSGFTNASGEVVALGDSADNDGKTPPGAIPYDVKDVPWVMYFDFDAEALHGAYWHNNFGQRMSHGCINQPVDVAAFMFEFAPLGTEVIVTEDSLMGTLGT